MANAIRQQLIEALSIPQVLVEEKHPIARSIRLRGDCLEVFGADLSQPVATFPRHHIDDATAIYQAIDNQPRHWHPTYLPLGKPLFDLPNHPVLAVGATIEACVQALGEQQADRNIEMLRAVSNPQTYHSVVDVILHGSPMKLTLRGVPGGWVVIGME